jgi:hypothetical protein
MLSSQVLKFMPSFLRSSVILLFADTHNPQESSSNADGTTTRERKRILQFVQEMNHELRLMQKCFHGA